MQAPQAAAGIFPIEDPLLLSLVIVGATALGFWLHRRVKALATVGATLLVIIFGALMSNFGIVTDDPASPVLRVVSGPITSLGIIWLLLSVHLSDLKLAGSRMLIAFGIAAVGTALGALCGGLIFAATYGDMTWRLAATLTGTYTGGSLNFAAVGRWSELPPDFYTAATAADNLVTGLWMGATLGLPLLLGRFYPTPIPQPPAGESLGGAAHQEMKHPFFSPARLSVLNLAGLLALGLAILWLSEQIPGWLGKGSENEGVLARVPSILWLTSIALIVGHVPKFTKLEGTMQLGNFSLHLFFVYIGILSNVERIKEVGWAILWFTMTVVLIHGVFTFVVGRLARIDIGTLAVASQAAIGGPTSALAVAVSRRWPALVLPGMMVGLLGYAAGTYAGIGVGLFLRRVMGF